MKKPSSMWFLYLFAFLAQPGCGRVPTRQDIEMELLAPRLASEQPEVVFSALGELVDLCETPLGAKKMIDWLKSRCYDDQGKRVGRVAISWVPPSMLQYYWEDLYELIESCDDDQYKVLIEISLARGGDKGAIDLIIQSMERVDDHSLLMNIDSHLERLGLGSSLFYMMGHWYEVDQGHTEDEVVKWYWRERWKRVRNIVAYDQRTGRWQE